MSRAHETESARQNIISESHSDRSWTINNVISSRSLRSFLKHANARREHLEYSTELTAQFEILFAVD